MGPGPDPRVTLGWQTGFVRGLDALQLELSAADFFAGFAWDGPPPDPGAQSAEEFLLGL